MQVGLNRATVFIGPATMKGYTMESDVRATKRGRRMGDVGLINNGYTLDMQGVHQKLQIRSLGLRTAPSRRKSRSRSRATSGIE